MLDLLLYSLLSYGITFIIVYTFIFTKIREMLYKLSPNFLGELINCPVCTGFWVGVFLSFHTSFLDLNSYIIAENIYYVGFLKILFSGALTSGICWLFYCLTEFLFPTPIEEENE